jgi:hypothetical protein
MSIKAAKHVRQTIREWRLASTKNHYALEDLPRLVDPVVRGVDAVLRPVLPDGVRADAPASQRGPREVGATETQAVSLPAARVPALAATYRASEPPTLCLVATGGETVRLKGKSRMRRGRTHSARRSSTSSSSNACARCQVCAARQWRRRPHYRERRSGRWTCRAGPTGLATHGRPFAGRPFRPQREADRDVTIPQRDAVADDGVDAERAEQDAGDGGEAHQQGREAHAHRTGGRPRAVAQAA